jgi:hypothetical protein
MTFLSALISAVLAIVLIENEIEDSWWIHVNVLILLGLPLFTALHVWLENLDLSKPKKQIILFLGIGLMGLLLFEIPYIKLLPQSFALHFFGFAILFHLLAAFLPFFKSNSVQAFWQFNKSMFLRFLLGALYSAALYGGLSLALLGVQFLLEVEMHEKIWIDLLLIIALPFNTIFFLGGVPKDVLSLEDDLSFPNGLKKFVQYVLMPLVVIYLGILYVYSVKITFLTELPKGFVTYLILAFAIAGMLALLLVSPLQTDEKTQWVKWYTKVYYWALWPLVILLFVAISTRLLEYGWTENRLIIFGLAVWLLGITTYFTLFKGRNIIMIPLSLFVLVAVLLAGPLSAENVALRSQRNRLESLLLSQNWIDEEGALEPDKIRNSQQDSVKYELYQSISFLAEHFGNRGIEGFLPVDSSLAPLNDENEAYDFKNRLEEELNLPSYNPSGSDRVESTQSAVVRATYTRDNLSEIPLLGASRAYRLDQYSKKYWMDNEFLYLEKNGRKVEYDLTSLFKKIPFDKKGDEYQNNSISNDLSMRTIEIEGEKLVVQMFQFTVTFNRKSGEIIQVYVDEGFILEY